MSNVMLWVDWLLTRDVEWPSRKREFEIVMAAEPRVEPPRRIAAELERRVR